MIPETRPAGHKAKKLVGMLYQKFSLYANPYIMARLHSQIRPHLESGAQVWHPHLATDSYSAKICPKNVFKKLEQ